MCIKVKSEKIKYSKEPEDGASYTEKMNKIYSRWTKAYDKFIAVFPLWRKWLKSVLMHIEGQKLLEVSFGTGYLLTQYPKNIELFGIDYNKDMVKWADAKLKRIGREAKIIQGNVEKMPYNDGTFDTVVNTMAFSGYPNGKKALSEMIRVLKPGGRLLLLDYDFPLNRNIIGYWMVAFMEKCGDIIKDINTLINESGCLYEKKIIGGSGSVQLFIITKET